MKDFDEQNIKKQNNGKQINNNNKINYVEHANENSVISDYFGSNS